MTNEPGAPASFGTQSWRISNAYTSGTFGDMPFSPSLNDEAGETQAQNGGFSGGNRKNHFDAQWSFLTADPTLTGADSYVSISPDRGDGARMSYIRLEDHVNGIEVHFNEYIDAAPYGEYGNPITAANGCGPEDDFHDRLVATVSRTRPHSVKLSIDFVDGPRNDVVKVYVDGTLRYTGTTWRTTSAGAPSPAAGRGQPRKIKVGHWTHCCSVSVEVRARLMRRIVARVSSSITCSTPATTRVHAITTTVTVTATAAMNGSAHFHFDKQGCEKADGDNARHDDDSGGHHFQSTSVDAADYDTVATGGRVTMVGSGTDNGEPVTFTLVAINNGALLPSSYSLVLSNGYAWTGTVLPGLLDIQ